MANAEGRRFPAPDGGEGAQQLVLRADDADLALAELDPRGGGRQMVAAVAAGIGAPPPPPPASG